MKQPKETLTRAIKAVRQYAVSKNKNYFSVTLKWQSVYPNVENGYYEFSAYIDGFTHVDSETIAGLIKEFDKVTEHGPTIQDIEDDLPNS